MPRNATPSRWRRRLSRPWRAWRLARRSPWLSYREAWRCCIGTRPAGIVGHVPEPPAVGFHGGGPGSWMKVSWNGQPITMLRIPDEEILRPDEIEDGDDAP